MLRILRINESVIFPLLVFFFLASKSEYCDQTQCALMCIELNLPLHSVAEKSRCCCRNDDDISKLHTIIKGPCPYITGEYDDGIVQLDVGNQITGNYYGKGRDKFVSYNGTIDSSCKGNVTYAGSPYSLKYHPHHCQILWSDNVTSYKKSCFAT